MTYSFAELLRSFRTRAGSSQHELAGAAGCGRNTLSTWESGKYLPKDRQTVERLALALALDEQETNVLLVAASFAPQHGSEARPPVLPPALRLVPRVPSLLIGRDGDLDQLRALLGVYGRDAAQMTPPCVVIHGWPGVGKTSLTAALANDQALAEAFPDGILWASLGEKPDLLAELVAWGEALKAEDIPNWKTVDIASHKIASLIKDKSILLIVDDVWETNHARPFLCVGNKGAVVTTTRHKFIASTLVPDQKSIYNLRVLNEHASVQLLAHLAPNVIQSHQASCVQLVNALEGLPLAIQVAGRLLESEGYLGFDVEDLLVELRETTKLLELQAPAEFADLLNNTTPTVASLLKRSIDRLDPHYQELFAYLGAFAPKPATFSVEAMKLAWNVTNPKPIIKLFVDRGLLEPSGQLRFQMHALLAMLARSLLKE